MIYRSFLFALILLPSLVFAQSCNEDLLAWRNAAKQGMMRGNHAMKQEGIDLLRYFEPDADYCIRANFTATKNGKKVVLKSANGGKPQMVTEYCIASFELMGRSLKLHIYKLIAAKGADNIQYFVPFTDPTNSLATYRGGRYLNLDKSDFKGNKVFIDFNKCYNPRTAYVRGYPGIIPPKENNLPLEINAGEKTYGEDPGF